MRWMYLVNFTLRKKFESRPETEFSFEFSFCFSWAAEEGQAGRDLCFLTSGTKPEPNPDPDPEPEPNPDPVLSLTTLAWDVRFGGAGSFLIGLRAAADRPTKSPDLSVLKTNRKNESNLFGSTKQIVKKERL